MADFLELGELMCRDALEREESCGGHFREEYQTRGGRGAARRRELLPRRGLGVRGRGPEARSATRAARVRERATFRRGATSERQRQDMNLTLHVWRQKNAPTTGALRHLRGATSVSPDMSFLEMLDVVNEELTAQGRGADRLRPRLPRGHLRHVRLVVNGRPHGPRHAHHRLPAPHADASRTATTIVDRALAGEGLPGRQGPRRRPQRLRPDHRGRRLRLRAHRQRARRQRHPGPEGRTPSSRWTPPPASAAAPASPPARTPRRCSSRRPRSSQLGAPAAGPAGARARACARWSRPMDAEGFGDCTNHGECEAACPKGIQLDVHRPDEPRLPQGQPHGRRGVQGRRRSGLESPERAPGRAEHARDLEGLGEGIPNLASARSYSEHQRLVPGAAAQRPHHRVDGQDHDPGVALARPPRPGGRGLVAISPSARWTVAIG